MIKFAHKGMIYSESVKAKMNGAYSSSLDRISINHAGRLEFNQWLIISIFLNQTHFSELSLSYSLITSFRELV